MEIRALEQPGQAAKAPAQIEDESVRFVLLQIGNQEVQQEGFARTGAPENDGVRNVPMMQIEEVGGVVAGLKDRQVFPFQMLIHGLAGMEGEQE